ncbi:MAG: hypothetical protein WC732_07220 [Candidatus Omnitrophota bacterium]
MPYHSLDSISQETTEFRNEVFKALSEATSYGKYDQPLIPWFEGISQSVRQHPWLFLAGAFVVIFLAVFLTRELICGYLKTNEILSRLKKLEERLKP